MSEIPESDLKMLLLFCRRSIADHFENGVALPVVPDLGFYPQKNSAGNLDNVYVATMYNGYDVACAYKSEQFLSYLGNTNSDRQKRMDVSAIISHLKPNLVP